GRAPALQIVHDFVHARVQTPGVESLVASQLPPGEDSPLNHQPIAPAFPAIISDAIPASQPRATATSGGVADSAVMAPTPPPMAHALDPSCSLPANSSVPAMTIEPLPAANTAPEPIAEKRLVLETLRRYEQAYDHLDAAAARQVWPTVDSNALAKAFSGLINQNVSLGHCNVEVTGGLGRAACTGTVRWTPRIGGGPHFQSRRWSFQLRGGDEGWTIVTATV